MSSNPKNPWSPSDEGDHHPVMKEWWTIESTFTTEDGRQWNLMSSFAKEMETPSCFFQYVLFDISARKCVAHQDINDNIAQLSFTKNKIEVEYKQSFIKGTYPIYHIHIDDPKQQLAADFVFTAKSLPHWIAQEQTNGNLPIGLNTYKYGFIPNLGSKGTLTIKGVTYPSKGIGYLEHAWGDWSYQHPLKGLTNLSKTLGVYVKLGKWWLSHHPIHIPQTITFSTDNNVFGYD